MPISSNISSLNSITPSTNNLLGELKTIFEHSYFNIIINNIYGARQSSHYFDVDYSTTQFLPVNLSLLISQSAAISTVQDSNYTSKRVISSRYEGTKVSSSDYTLAGREAYGPQYAIDKTTPYFGVFEEVGDSFPKGGGGSRLTISKLVYKDGTIIPLDNQNFHVFDVQNVFHNNTKAYIYYTEKSGGLNDALNVETRSVDESGFLYNTIAFYKPTNTSPSGASPYTLQEDNVVYYSYLNTLATSSIYNEAKLYGFNNLLAQKHNTDKELYFYYGLPSTSSAGTDPFNSTGYFIGIGMLLRNFYPGTGEQYSSYSNYPWVRFQHFSTGSIENYNITINTDFLPLREGDYIRVYDDTEAQINDEVYSYDKDIFFLQNASGSPFQDAIYDSLIETIEYTLPNSTGFLSAASGTLSLETLLITNNSASVYQTTDRFGDIPSHTGPSDTRLLPVYNANVQAIDPTGASNSLGKGVQFKKIYSIDNWYEFDYTSTFTPGLQKFKYWAIGTSGSLYRSEGVGGVTPFNFDQVPDALIDVSCSFNSMFFFPDNLINTNPNFYTTNNNNWNSLKASLSRGLFVAVGDSGSVYASVDWGNTFTKINFPSSSISLNDVFCGCYGGPDQIFIVVVGTSGSIYYTHGSGPYPSNSTSFFNEIQSNWQYMYSDSLVDIDSGITGKAWPSVSRSLFTFNRIIPLNAWANHGGFSFTDTQQVLAFLANSGSIFTSPPGIYDANYNPASNLIAVTGSFFHSKLSPAQGYIFPSSSNFIDGIITGSIYSLISDLPSIQTLWLNKTGSIYKNSNIANTIYNSPATPNTTKIYENTASASFNEMRSITSINYSLTTPSSSTYIWIPTSKSTLLYQSASGVWSAGTATFKSLNINTASYFTSNSNYPTTSFYSIINAENTTGASPLYVKLGLQKSFPTYFYNGGSSFAYGVNSSYGNGASAPLNKFTGTRQAWRLYRKYSNEQYVLTREYVQDGKGFIIPENYDPSLNYVEIAKKAGLIF